eukprot:SM000091S24586  [mRNA]  locus=s91:132910:134570:- [translate_table: standard]
MPASSSPLVPCNWSCFAVRLRAHSPRRRHRGGGGGARCDAAAAPAAVAEKGYTQAADGTQETLEFRIFIADDAGKKASRPGAHLRRRYREPPLPSVSPLPPLPSHGQSLTALATCRAPDATTDSPCRPITPATNAAVAQVSPWHDIPLHAGDGTVHFVCEIPRETSAKMEVATDEPLTPIKQDTKKGKLRYYPYNINWNYGLLPQTWEDPSFANPEVDGCFGDNDPVDLVEIGERTATMGEVYRVKPLAVLAMIDEGELDWKVVGIRADDPKAAEVDDIDSVEKVFPGTLTAIRDWFRDYKIPDGKPANKFGLDNKPAGKDYALKVIEETNESWAKLVKRAIPAGELSLS